MTVRAYICVCVALLAVSLLAVTSIRNLPGNDATMADTAARDPPPERTDFQELEDGEDLFPEPAATQEVRRAEEVEEGGGGGDEGRPKGAVGRQGVMLPADSRRKLHRRAGGVEIC